MSLPLQFRVTSMRASISGQHEVTLEQMPPPPMEVGPRQMSNGPQDPSSVTPQVLITIAVSPGQFADARIGTEFSLDQPNAKIAAEQQLKTLPVYR